MIQRYPTTLRIFPGQVSFLDRGPFRKSIIRSLGSAPRLAGILCILLFASICLPKYALASPSVTLTWTASTSTVVGYNVYRGDTSGGPYTRLNGGAITGTSYADTAVVEGQTYYYVATSVDGSGQESVFSNEAQAYIPYATVTSQLAANPSSIDFGSISVSSTGSRSVSLTNSGPADVRIFGNSVTGAGFAVSGLSSSFILPAGQSTSFTATFTPSTAGAASGSISVVSNASNSPTNLSLSGNGVSPSHSVDLTWTASTSQVNGYNIYRGGQSGGPYTKMNSTLISSTLYTDTTVQEAQTYFY